MAQQTPKRQPSNAIMDNLMRKFIVAALAPVFVAVAAAAGAADIAAGKAKVMEVCQACHGLDGNSPTPDYPKLGGQYPDYLAKALRDYRSGLRKNAIMAGFAGTLSPQDIDNLAAYYAAQPAVVRTKH
jgi:cytochrome c553